jgi:hypothetical protein
MIKMAPTDLTVQTYQYSLTGFSVLCPACQVRGLSFTLQTSPSDSLTVHQNPFDPRQPLDSNPFEPSAISSNPFSHPNDSASSLNSQDTERGLGGAASQPYDSIPNQGHGHGQSSASVKKTSDYDERMRVLREREAEVAARERAVGIQQNNWPPCMTHFLQSRLIDERCAVFPFVHHDISTLPTQHQTVTKLLYYQWLALAVTLIVNLLGAIFLLVAGSSEGG